ncbi:hypothetical protein D4Q85_00220 [bacterium]|nr:MAG: hypothetical protein D4Q85_00220 [bacterium]
MKAILSALTAVSGVFVRVWDRVFDPKRLVRKANAEADKAVAEHDEEAVNRILAQGKLNRRDP